MEFLIKEASLWQKCLNQWPFGGGRPRESWHTHFRMKESKPLDVRSFEERGFRSMGSCHVAKAGIISSRKKALKITVQLSRWLAPIGCFVRHVCDEHCLRNDKHNRRLYRLRGRLPVTTYIESLFNNRELVNEESVKHTLWHRQCHSYC